PTSTPTSVASAPGEARENDAPPRPPPPAVSEEDAIPDDALEFDPARTDASSVFVEPAPSPEWSAATGTFKAMMAANQEAVQPPEIEPQALKEPRPAKREQPPAGRPPEAAHPPPPQATRPPPRPAATALMPAESEAPPAPAPYRRVLRVVRPPKGEWLVSVAWGAGAVVAALALLAQIVDHHRDELAANARFNRPLTALY